MARRTSITNSLGEVPQDDAVSDNQEQTQEQETVTSKKARSTSSKRQNSSTPKKAAQTPQQPAEIRAQKKPAVRSASTAEAKRISLYVHPDDFRELGMAKLDDGADANARIRAMLAVWRDNDRFRKQVDRLARTTPRGPGSNS